MSIKQLYIVTFDILGFKSLIEEHPLVNIVKMYRDLIKIGTPIKFRSTKESSKAKDSFTEDIVLKHTVFSDSMIIWTEPTKSNINYFIYLLSLLMGNSILKQLPLRFGIAYGKCEMDISAQIFVGQPIIDAHLTESNQEWIGGAFHKSCYSSPYFDLMKGLKFALPYDVPIKKKPKPEFAVNWAANDLNYDWNLEDFRSALHKGADKAKSPYKAKWWNTVSFIDSLSGRSSIETK